jgi:hypothetical protein
MSGKEPDPLAVMAGVKRQELTLVKASDLLGLGYRQTKGGVAARLGGWEHRVGSSVAGQAKCPPTAGGGAPSSDISWTGNLRLRA